MVTTHARGHLDHHTSTTAVSRLASDTRLQPAAEAYINSVVLAEIGYSRAKFIYIYRATHTAYAFK